MCELIDLPCIGSPSKCEMNCLFLKFFVKTIWMNRKKTPVEACMHRQRGASRHYGPHPPPRAASSPPPAASRPRVALAIYVYPSIQLHVSVIHQYRMCVTCFPTQSLSPHVYKHTHARKICQVMSFTTPCATQHSFKCQMRSLKNMLL